jgi:hypothetical protein
VKPAHRNAALAACAGALGLWWWLAPGEGHAVAQAEPAPLLAAAPPAAGLTLAPASAPARDRRAERALWSQRLERAQRALDTYRHATRYPHDSRPLREHPDQVYPNQPIAEERPLREPGGPVIEGLTLRTTQERVFAQGDESVLFTVAAVDGEGRALPLTVPRAIVREGAPRPGTAPMPIVPVQFTDDGRQGDAAAGDQVLSFRLQPSRIGYGSLEGVIRVELALQSGEHPGFAYFDVIHSAAAPATWGPGPVRDVVEAGSLALYLPAEVIQPGRYVATGRIDDANGRPLALASFNEELAAGRREIRLQVFGKLLRDTQAAFPLTLRDVDAFLLKPDTFPDRALMPRRAGAVHRTGNHPLAAFSTAEWSSEERQRYLDEYTKDVDEAEGQLKDLGPGP